MATNQLTQQAMLVIGSASDSAASLSLTQQALLVIGSASDSAAKLSLTQQALLVIHSVPPTNSPPQAGDGFQARRFQTTKNRTLQGTGLLNNIEDINGHALSVNTTPVTPSVHGLLTLLSNGDFTFEPNANYSGPDAFVYAVEDTSGGSLNVDAEIMVYSSFESATSGDTEYRNGTTIIKLQNTGGQKNIGWKSHIFNIKESSTQDTENLDNRISTRFSNPRYYEGNNGS